MQPVTEVYYICVVHFSLFSRSLDLMLPGIIQTERAPEQEFEREQVCSVALLGNRYDSKFKTYLNFT